MDARKTIEKILHDTRNVTSDDLSYLLSLPPGPEQDLLFSEAYRVKLANTGRKVSIRGLIELSSVCTKDCFYCGIRKSNKNVMRYTMSEDDAVSAAMWADSKGYGSIVLQSGERSDAPFTDMIERLVKRIKKESSGRLGITLSCGEQTEETYLRWREAGAHRYLLRIEASEPELYAKLHPADHSYENRKNCLEILSRLNYQAGTGVMSGLPFQTFDDLAHDIMFFKKMNVDMIGMGPYIVHEDTPLAGEMPFYSPSEHLELGLRMIAVTRLYLKDVNIASTTALQTLSHDGRARGLLAGANVIMPNVTEKKYRAAYQLYEGKPGLADGPENSLESLVREVEAVGETIDFNEWGDSPHFSQRVKNHDMK